MIRTAALIAVIVILVALVARDVIERGFDADIRMAEEQAKAPVVASSTDMSGPSSTAPGAGFRGPTGEPKIQGPKFPPPDY